MSAPAIRVRDLSKRYQLAAGRARYATLREAIVQAATAPWRRFRELAGRAAEIETFWALRQISFDVQPGDVVGIIGHNGAGKSTLLKILSQITEPTAGRVELEGRVASLLEVGTGFHPELSGRENVFLNGAILGMRHKEIKRKFDAIVGFAEVEKFIDMPVKRYSSGMAVRLAFAVAAHLDPEILVVDEVLAVGDASFQKRCLGKMQEVSAGGRTVLFVSHNMPAVKSLCSRAILLEQGRLTCDGTVDEVVAAYLFNRCANVESREISDAAPRLGTGEVRIRSVRLTDLSGQDVTELYFGQPFRVSFVCEARQSVPAAHFEVSVSSPEGVQVTCCTTHGFCGGEGPSRLDPGLYEVSTTVETPLLPRDYCLTLGIHRDAGLSIDFLERALDFTVLKVPQSGTHIFPWKRARGYVRAMGCWSLSAVVPERCNVD